MSAKKEYNSLLYGYITHICGIDVKPGSIPLADMYMPLKDRGIVFGYNKQKNNSD
jgi:hypothetical protein